MEAEAQHYLEKVKRVRNIGNERGNLIQKAVRFLTYRERKDREDEQKWIKNVISQPPWVLKELSADRRGQFTKRLNSIEDDLKDNAPPTNLEGTTKDALVVRLKELDDKIREGMPSEEVMRRNPAGAIGMHTRWHKANVERILERKNILRLLDPNRDGEDPDYASVEMLRPAGITRDMAATFMMGAQIPGNFGMTPLAKANWPVGMPAQGTVDNPLKQAERNEIVEERVLDKVIQLSEIDDMKAVLKELQASNAELKAALEAKSAEIVKPKSRKWSKEQKQAARDRWAAKRENRP